MRKLSIQIFNCLDIWYNHYLSDKFIKEEVYYNDFEGLYPLYYYSRRFDKPAEKRRNGTCIWCLDSKWHRVGKPACIWADGDVWYYENGKKVK